MKRIFAHIGFSFALTLLVINMISVSLVPVIAAALLIFFIASIILPKYRKALSLPLCLGSAIFACLIFLTVYYSSVYPESRLDGVSAMTTFYITDLPHKTDFGYSYIARAVTLERDGAVQNFKFRLISDKAINAEAYNVISGKLKFYNIGNNAFSSYGYWGKGIYLTARVNDYSLTGETVNSPMRFFQQIREFIISTLTSGIKGDAGSLAAALITGNKDALSNDVYFCFKRAGVTHLMAVSGLHLTVISGAFTYLLSALRVPEKLRATLTVLIIILFSAVTGFTPSVTRASIMMITIFSAGFFGKRGDALNSLGLAVLLICLNPFAVSDVGAVLSVLSVLSLCTLYPVVKHFLNERITKLFKRRSELISNTGEFIEYVIDIIAASFCIILYNLPALYLFFYYLSPLSVFSNVLLIPLGSVSTVMSFIAVIFSHTGGIAKLVFALDGKLNNALISVVRLFAQSRYYVIPAGKYLGVILALILIIIAICFILNNKKLLKYTALISVCALVLYQGAYAVQSINTAEVFITKNVACAVSCGGDTLIIGVKNKSDYYDVKGFINNKDGISLLVASDGKDSITEKLIEEYPCGEVISYTFSDSVLSKTQEYRRETDCTEKLNDYLSITVHHTDKGYSYIISANGVCISDGSALSDITVNNKTVSDINGSIDLSKSDVIYSISKNKSYSARRVEVWEN